MTNQTAQMPSLIQLFARGISYFGSAEPVNVHSHVIIPVGTQCSNDVVSTSMRRDRIDVDMMSF